MLHRAGNVDGEGDGCGLSVDIPRELWAEEVRAGGHASSHVLDPRFAVAHVFIPRGAGDLSALKDSAREMMSRIGLRVLAERDHEVVTTALGPQAREEEPLFWQVGGLIEDERACFELTVQLETALDVHVASCSRAHRRLQGARIARGARRLLPGPARRPRQDRRGATATTATRPTPGRPSSRVQPFGVLGHNGEINTIAPPPPGGADDRRAVAARRLRLSGPRAHRRGADPPRAA